jgi:glycosyltransferase involved in cell wall biosynthesis
MRSKSILFISPSGKGGGTLASINLLGSIATRTYSWINVVALGGKSSRVPDHGQLSWVSIPWLADYDKIVDTLERRPLLAFLYTFPILFPVSLFLTLRLRKEIVLLYGNGGLCGVIAGIIARLFRKKSIAHIHADTGLSRKSFVLCHLYRKALNRVDYILANSRDVGSDLIMLGLPEQKISVVVNWVDVEKFKPLDREAVRKNLGFRDEEFISLYVGRFVDYKEMTTVLGAARETLDRETLFVFIGHGPLEEEVKSLAVKQKNVRFIGYVDDERQLAQYYNAADILALGAIDIDYASLTVMEALACGLPVVVSNRPAVRREGIRCTRNLPGHVGFMIDPEPGELKRMVSYLKQNRQLLGSMRLECRRFAEENFGESNIEKVYDEIFVPLLTPVAGKL